MKFQNRIKKLISLYQVKYFLCIAALCFFFSFTYAEAEETASTKEELIQIIYESMVKQEKNIIISYAGADYLEIHDQFMEKILPEEIFTIDKKDTSDDADYMAFNLEKIGVNTKTELFGNAKFSLELKWKESQEQTNRINKKVKQILEELNLEKDSNYKKVKKIHNYIIDNVSYDNSLTCFTAYDALVKGKTTCSGYMLLTYKLLTEAGIDCRCISGKGISQGAAENHGWNIVKLGDKWYNLDTTWDDPVIYQADGTITEEGKQEFQYYYFLKGSKSFDERHQADKKYKTAEFEKKNPISTADFSLEEYKKWGKNHKEKTIQESGKINIKMSNIEKEAATINVPASNKIVNLILVFLIFMFLIRIMRLFKK